MSDYAPSASIQEEVLSFLMTAPTPQQIIDFRASNTAQERLRFLLEVNRQGVISDQERYELDDASRWNHLVILMKAKAHKLQ